MPQITGIILLLGTMLAGCALVGIPSKHNPSCSWSTSPPADADQLCSVAFSALTSVVNAVESGDQAAIHRLVTNKRVAQNIIAYSRLQRAAHAHSLHVVPSFTLEITDQGLLGAGFYVLGKNDSGNVNSPQTVYMVVHGNRATIVQDQPNQDW